jgi:hypothetical protein
MSKGVEISFDCLPLRSIGRLDIPIDASPKYRQRCERLLEIIETHGQHSTYYLYNAQCVFRLTNSEEVGTLTFGFDGTALTDESDSKTKSCDLEVHLRSETCDWISDPIVQWFKETVTRAVIVEFDLYIAAGDLEQTRQRIDKIQSESDEQGGFVGMYL